jgi:hypothetical protein
MRVKPSAVRRLLTELAAREHSDASNSVRNRFAIRIMTMAAGHRIHGNQSMTGCQASAKTFG